jgi:serine/threonine-protein kinase
MGEHSRPRAEWLTEPLDQTSHLWRLHHVFEVAGATTQMVDTFPGRPVVEGALEPDVTHPIVGRWAVLDPATTGDRSRIVAGKYRLLSVLGQGGMGTVWHAQHLQLGATVAVKLIDPNAAGGADALRQCHKEAHAAAALRSPHVVQVLDVGRDDATGSPFIVMELLEGESLADRLNRRGKLSLAETARVMTHVARALSRAHEAGIIHRDLKPANVFLVRNDDEELAKVLDFGIARVQRLDGTAGSTTATGRVDGTPHYMSPEHISAQPVDHRTDLWAMAVMAFECVTGRKPFTATDIGQLVLQICTYPIPVPSQVAPVATAIDAWFQRATRRAPDQRFQSARELADDLRRICTETTAPVIAPGRASMLEPAIDRSATTPRPHRRSWWLGGAAGALLGAVVAATAAASALLPGARASHETPTPAAMAAAPVAPPGLPAPVPRSVPASAMRAAPAVAAGAARKPALRSVRGRAHVRFAAGPAGVASRLDHRR